ncbi:helicase [Levilactobacillus bambusae]|uniref:Helicase n=1 Tax=Levilactobacillus bambusae TaxID=2024736 RepID=A0A2V1MZ27_9LACO|nr:helicase [Levilactobacillus bambusae]
MGLFNSIIGNASSANPEKAQQDLAPLLIPGEEVEFAMKTIRDWFVLTNKRVLLTNRQGTGKKVEYRSIPYYAVTKFSLETAGHFEFEGVLRIWTSGQTEPEMIQLDNGGPLAELERRLAGKIL